jgi:hypothetical protein
MKRISEKLPTAEDAEKRGEKLKKQKLTTDQTQINTDSERAYFLSLCY